MNNDPKFDEAKKLIDEFAVELLKLNGGKALPPEWKDHLLKALGPIRRGPPVDPDLPQRNVKIAVEVIRLVWEGRPLADNAGGEGAFAEVAQSHDLSASEVRDIYYKNRWRGYSKILQDRLRKKDSA